MTIAARAGTRTATYYIRCLPSDFPDWTVTGTGDARTTGRWRHRRSRSERHGALRGDLRRERRPGLVVPDQPRPDRRDAAALGWAGRPSPSLRSRRRRQNFEIHRLDGTRVGTIVSPDGHIDDHELQRASNGDYVYLVYDPKQHVDLTPYGGPARRDGARGEDRGDLAEGQARLVVVDRRPRRPVGVDALALDDPRHAGDPHGRRDDVRLLPRERRLARQGRRAAVAAPDRRDLRDRQGHGADPLEARRHADAAEPHRRRRPGRRRTRSAASTTCASCRTGRSRSSTTARSSGGAPRAVHYRIDTTAHTATWLGQITDPAIGTSLCCGSARMLANGNWEVSWGGDDVVGEYDAGRDAAVLG